MSCQCILTREARGSFERARLRLLQSRMPRLLQAIALRRMSRTRRPRSAFIRVPMGTCLSPLMPCVQLAHSMKSGLIHSFAQDGNKYPRQTSRNDNAYRVMLPFFLIIAVVLLLVIRLVHSSTPSSPPQAILCPGTSQAYHVSRGDTCWDLAQSRSCTVDDILAVNEDLRCEALRPGQAICLPAKVQQ